MRNKLTISAAFSVLALLCAVLFSNGCVPPKAGEFAIYLTKNDIPLQQMEAQSHLELAAEPVISMDDIVVYNQQTHDMKLTDAAFERVSRLDVPVRGKSFVVCVDNQPIYWGAFWTPLSSMSFSGVTIWKPLSIDVPHIFTMELGYPSDSFYGGEDPRNNPEVINALQKAGKLAEKLNLGDITWFPESMKGYELYSWPRDGQWRFALITGTNRNKTLDEIISGGDYISEVGWVKVTVTGVEDIKAVLAKVPAGSFVTWLGSLRDPAQPSASNIQLPPQQIIDAVKARAAAGGLEFSVMTG